MEELEKESLFPDPFAKKSKKEEKAYGLSFVKGMWTREQNLGLSFYSRRDRIQESRLWAEGTQSIEHIKGQIEDGDTSWLKFNLSVSQPIPKLVSIFEGNIMNRTFDIVAESLDKNAKHERDAELERRLRNIKLKENADIFEKAGIPVPVEKDDGFKTPKEAEADLKLNYKVPVEEAAEFTVKDVFEQSNGEYIKQKLARDFAVAKCGVTRAYRDAEGRSKVRYVDVADFIHSYVKYDDFSDMYYGAEVMEMSLTDARVRYQDADLKEDDWKKIASSYQGKLGNPEYEDYYGDLDFNRIQDFKIQLIDFQFKSENTYRYKKKSSKKGSGFIFEEVDEEYELPKNTNRKTELKERVFSDIYEGIWVIGTDYLLKYMKKPNMVRKTVGGIPSTDAELDFKVYAPNLIEGVNKSLVELMIPHAENIILYQLKTQQYVSKAAPPGIGVDVTALQGVISGMGDPSTQGNSFTNLTTLYKHTGDVYYSSVREDGTPIQNTSPIIPLSNGISDSVNNLLNLSNDEMRKIYQVTGFNEIIDGSAQTKDTAIGAEKIRANSFNIAIKPLADAHTMVLEKTFTHVAEIEKDRIINDKEYAEYVIEKMGEKRVDYIKLVNDVKYSDISVYIRFRPTEEDLLSFNKFLNDAMVAGQINIANAMRASQMSKVSIKAAQQYLEEAIEIELGRQRETSQMQQEQNAAVQERAAQAKMNADLARIEAEGMRDLKLQREKYHFEMELAGLEGIQDRMTEVTKGEVKKELLEEIEGGETQKTDPERTVNPAKPTVNSGTRGMVQTPKMGIKPSDDVQRSI